MVILLVKKDKDRLVSSMSVGAGAEPALKAVSPHVT